MRHLETLEIGTSFKTESGKRGTLLGVGTGSVKVQWLGTEKTRSFTPQAKPGEKPKTVTVRSGPVTENIAGRTEVTIIAGGR
jgi:hypothetical protein